MTEKQNIVKSALPIVKHMQQHLKDQLDELRLCLRALPSDIPIPRESKYKFSDFSLDADWIADAGEVAAVNRELEVRLGSRINGLKLVERGPEMEAIVPVLKTWVEKYPGDIILEKWVCDTLKAAQGLILVSGKAVSQSYYLSDKTELTSHDSTLVVTNPCLKLSRSTFCGGKKTR